MRYNVSHSERGEKIERDSTQWPARRQTVVRAISPIRLFAIPDPPTVQEAG